MRAALKEVTNVTDCLCTFLDEIVTWIKKQKNSRQGERCESNEALGYFISEKKNDISMYYDALQNYGEKWLQISNLPNSVLHGPWKYKEISGKT